MDRLIPVLETMVEEHTSLFELAQEKTEVLKKGDINGLDRIMAKEEALASRIGQLEAQRLRMVGELLNVSQEDATFSAIIEAAPETHKETLEEIQLKLMSLIFDLKYQNDLNQSLIQQSLDWVHLNLSLLKPEVKAFNYSNKKKQQIPDFSDSKPRFDFHS